MHFFGFIRCHNNIRSSRVPFPAYSARTLLSCSFVTLASDRRFRPIRGLQLRVLYERASLMLSWALTFLVIALIAAALGFGGIAGTAAGIAKIVFFLFLVFFVISLIMGRHGPVV